MGPDPSPSGDESASTALPASCLVWLWTHCLARALENILDVVWVPQSRLPSLRKEASRFVSHPLSECDPVARELGA